MNLASPSTRITADQDKELQKRKASGSFVCRQLAVFPSSFIILFGGGKGEEGRGEPPGEMRTDRGGEMHPEI
jgi:hypothetical protein